MVSQVVKSSIGSVGFAGIAGGSHMPGESDIEFSAIMSKSISSGIESKVKHDVSSGTDMAGKQNNVGVSSKDVVKGIKSAAGISNKNSNAASGIGHNESKKGYAKQHTFKTGASSDEKRIYTDKRNVESSTVNKVVNAVSDDVTNKIKETIKEELDVTDEKIQEAMSVLNMSAQDLLYPANISQLVMQLSDAYDKSQLLTDEGLSDALKNILKMLEEICKRISDSVGISSEQLKDVIDSEEFNEILSKQQMSADSDADDKQMAHDAGNMQQLEETKNEALADKQTHILNAVSDNNDDAAYVLEQKLVADNAGFGKDNANSFLMGENGRSNSQNGNPAGNVAQNLVQSMQQTFQSVMADKTDAQINATNIIRQIVDAVKVTGNRVVQSMEIQLNPEHLGKLSLTVTARNGEVTAQIIVQNEQVKKALESQMSQLKDNLSQQGIKVEAVEVTVQSHEFEANQSFADNQGTDGKNAKNSRKHINIDELTEFEQDEDSEGDSNETIIENENSSVEFTA